MKTQLRARRGGRGEWFCVTALAALLLGCQSESPNMDGPISAYRDRMLVQHQDEPAPSDMPAKPRDPLARPVPEQSQLPARSALLTEPAVATQPSPAEVLAELPDPADSERVFAERLERLRQEQKNTEDQRVVRSYERVVDQALKYLKIGAGRQQVQLSLSECIQRAIEHNYSIRIEAHNPAISQTQVVEAEAAFDVQFFLDTSWADLDAPVVPGSVDGSGVSDTRAISGGFRQLLPSGMQASVGLATQRQWSGIAQQGPVKTWNPTYPSNFVADFRQPLLKGFGLDVNRAQININKLQYQVSYETFVQKVRDTLLDVENTYWQLARTRRQMVIVVESVAQNLITYQNMVERLDHDATQVEVANSRSRWQTSYVNYLETIKLVRDAEDQLKNLLNDPSLKLSDRLEIITTETPVAAPTVLDHFAEVRTALDKRTEIRSAKKQIDVTRINTAVTKNAILPQLDLSFRYEVQGLGNTTDNSFDNLTTNRFISYTLGASFTYNFGERAARAAHRRARLQESQAVVALNQVTDTIVQEVNQSIRQLIVRYEQLPPALDSVQAASRNLRSLQARTQKLDPTYLQTELSAVEQLATTRNTLLTVLTDYNVGLVQFEKAKGTLLEYNNVVVTDDKTGR